MVTGPINANRFSAPLTSGATAEPLLDRGSSAVKARSSVAGTADTRAPSATGRVPVGRPISLTLPKAPDPHGPPAPSGIESMAEGISKTTRAQVDVSRRDFWRKCLGAAAKVTAVVLFSAATAGVGTVGLVGLGLMGGLAVKGSLDAALSLMNWRNQKAEYLNKPPPFPFLTKLPASVRQDATAAGLMRLGMPEKGAKLVSGTLETVMGLSAAACVGYSAAGVGGIALALAPVAVEKGIHAAAHHIEHRRQHHVEDAAKVMDEVSRATQQALDELTDLQNRLSDAVMVRIPPGGDAGLRALQERVDTLRADAQEQIAAYKDQLQARVERKAHAGVNGVSAVLLDSATEGAAHLTDTIKHTPLHAISITAMTLRTGLEYARTIRSERRDNDKLQSFVGLHGDLQDLIGQARRDLEQQVQELESVRDGRGSMMSVDLIENGSSLRSSFNGFA